METTKETAPKPASIVIGGTKNKGTIYWTVVGVVVAVFLVTTATYWLDTIKLLQENMQIDTQAILPIHRAERLQ